MVESWRGQPRDRVPTAIKALAAMLAQYRKVERENDAMLSDYLQSQGRSLQLEQQLRDCISRQAQRVQVSRDQAVRDMQEVESCL